MNALLSTLNSKKRYLVLPLDLMLAALSFHLAGIIRFDNFNPEKWGEPFPGYSEYSKIILILLLSRATFFVSMGLYKSIWAFASTHDLFKIMKSIILSTLTAVTALLFFNRLEGVSRSVLILDGIFLFLLLCMRSFSWRIFRDLIFIRLTRFGKPTLIIGAGHTTSRLLTELRLQHSRQFQPVGLLDDNPSKIGGYIQGLPVLGQIASINEHLKNLKIEAVIIAAQLPATKISEIYRICREKDITCKTLPPLQNIVNSAETALRDLLVEDLLGRDVINLKTEDIRRGIRNNSILITGAGGSIGSEVCRQLMNCEPAVIYLLDSAETPLYEIDYELRNWKGVELRKPQIFSIIGDVRNKQQIKQIFDANDIHTVFHCAAYKHVPMMELHPHEAVINNVTGTCNVADVARDAGVERFVLISTDKAVNPVNIMGATKRIAELYIQNLSRTTDTRFITVRFGNVLGSSGSVIPLFKKQIEAGGPVTITHPDIIRYFMTIQEAAGLVIQAGAMGHGGEIFILDMGEPIKIKDLAEDMIRFSGYIPHSEIEIRYIGLRPGEKLYEELLLDDEGIKPTHHKKIHIASSRNVNLSTLNKQIEKLLAAAASQRRSSLDLAISEILPEYHPVRLMDEGLADKPAIYNTPSEQEEESRS